MVCFIIMMSEDPCAVTEELTKMSEALQKHRLAITDTNENGDGFARLDRMAVFIPGLVSGDVADVTITDTRKNYAIGRCDRLLDRSVHRIAPVCADFGSCGGCTLCHVTYEYENAVKYGCVRSALRRVGLSPDVVREVCSTSARTGYRNKIGLHYDSSARAFGYNARSSHEVLPFTYCHLCTEEMNELVRYVNDHIDTVAPLSPTELFVRLSSDGGITVSLYTSSTDGPIEPFRALLTKRFEAVRDVVRISGENGGSASVTEEYLGVSMRFSSESFRQVNRDAVELLMNKVCDFAAEQTFSYAADLYCGSGAFGLVLAKRFPDAHFFGVELDRAAIEAARANAERNGLSNISFVCADAASFDGRIPDGRGGSYPPELVVVDPPRAGLSDGMRDGLLRLAPKRLVYVSCNPQTMARDLAHLVRGGYTLLSAEPVNMFPMTRHVECVCTLTR